LKDKSAERPVVTIPKVSEIRKAIGITTDFNGMPLVQNEVVLPPLNFQTKSFRNYINPDSQEVSVERPFDNDFQKQVIHQLELNKRKNGFEVVKIGENHNTSSLGAKEMKHRKLFELDQMALNYKIKPSERVICREGEKISYGSLVGGRNSSMQRDYQTEEVQVKKHLSTQALKRLHMQLHQKKRAKDKFQDYQHLSS